MVSSVDERPVAAARMGVRMAFGESWVPIFADLIVLPIIYRRYGWRTAGFLLASFYATMVAAGLIVEFVFDWLNLIPSERNAKIVEASVTLNYTTILDLVFLALGALLVWRYFTRRRRPADVEDDEQAMRHEHAHGHGHA